jgi:hypothetical protein
VPSASTTATPGPAPAGAGPPDRRNRSLMTSPSPAAPDRLPAGDDLTARVFQAFSRGFDLHAAGGTYIVVPAGTSCLAGPSPGDIARQISTRPSPAAGPGTPGPEQARHLETGPAR